MIELKTNGNKGFGMWLDSEDRTSTAFISQEDWNGIEKEKRGEAVLNLLEMCEKKNAEYESV